ncbi:hypothetical protein [Nocardia aurantia]|uniref:hypothetical protein n=1 Tax=Nocardia aurantia TaxID=2585199 RepID=UPI001295EA59|nr:hypothetical protein [Nocardia aurantia]
MGFREDMREADDRYISPEDQWTELQDWLTDFVPEAHRRGWKPEVYPPKGDGHKIHGWWVYGHGRGFVWVVAEDGSIWLVGKEGSPRGPFDSLSAAEILDVKEFKAFLTRALANPEIRFGPWSG